MTGVVMVGIEVIEHRRDETFRSVVLENVVEGLNLAQLIGDLAHDLNDRFDAILDHLDQRGRRCGPRWPADRGPPPGGGRRGGANLIPTARASRDPS